MSRSRIPAVSRSLLVEIAEGAQRGKDRYPDEPAMRDLVKRRLVVGAGTEIVVTELWARRIEYYKITRRGINVAKTLSPSAVR